ncbi:MAG TPA: hypothetical protein VK174_04610 [Chitinophagales bacterium]|nr:hypothetical protein [Chitinophagales bacterium]
MKKILLASVCCAFLIACNTKGGGVTNKDIVGSYSGTIKLDSIPQGNDETTQKTIEMLKSIKLSYEFKEDGTGKSAGEMMGMKNEMDIKWALQGSDTLKLDVKGREEIYVLKKTEKGMDLSAQGATIVLLKQ